MHGILIPTVENVVTRGKYSQKFRNGKRTGKEIMWLSFWNGLWRGNRITYWSSWSHYLRVWEF